MSNAANRATVRCLRLSTLGRITGWQSGDIWGCLCARWYIPMANPYPEEWLSYTYGQCDGKPCTGNRGASNIPRFDELIEELAGTTGDPAKRLEVSKELYDLLNDEMPAVPYQTGLISYVAWWDHLKGFQCDECTFGGQYKGAKWDYVWLDR